MYVCICHAITEEKLKEAMKETSTVNSRDVLKRLGVGESCGICLFEAINRIETMTHSSETVSSSQINSSPISK